MVIRVKPLGAGREVGRSCVLVELGPCRILIDCGASVGAKEDGHFPELDALVADGRPITEAVDAVIISHFHTDHIAALPYLTEVLGYRGPLLMTHPTRAIGPIVLQDYVKLRRNRGHAVRYTAEQTEACFARATGMQLEERVVVNGLAVTPYYAGHVLGAAMLLLEAHGLSCLYTGDFTTVPDHHLRVAKVPLSLRPDVMITESTYCTTVRSSKRAKELELCRKIQDTLEKGGKVLMPVFMIGRAQEMCLLCEKHWERAQLNYPIYIVRGNAEKALTFFRLFSSWSSNDLQKSDEPFNFKYAKLCSVEEVIETTEPIVVFAGPAMLQGGASLDLFKKWAPDPKNMIVFAGYCLPGTTGNDVQAKLRQIPLDGGASVGLRCSVEYMSHSDHTDSRGILQLIGQVAPKHVVLVHGDARLMEVFQPIVQRRLRIPCFAPAVGECVELLAEEACREVLVSPSVILGATPVPGPPPAPTMRLELSPQCCPPASTFSGLLVRRKRGAHEAFEILDRSAPVPGLVRHRLKFRHVAQALARPDFDAAWEAFEGDLHAMGATCSWEPSGPPLGEDFPPDAQYVARALDAVQCCVAGSDAGAKHVKVTVEWTQDDERRCAAVLRLVEALGGG